MSEGKRVLAGEAILSGALASDRARVKRTSRSARTIEPSKALEALVREHSRLVYRIAYAVLRRHHDAEDATQETFHAGAALQLEARRAWKTTKTWLARIAWRVAVDRSRQRGRSSAKFRWKIPSKPVAGSRFFRRPGGSDRARRTARARCWNG